ncbi:DUF3991 domain-containing protein [Lamprobacter modestohalophilus]|uniref:DUF3991 domain-containing protein n=1 Tax=Lamprobacter modestohalophilus TaxID=1064514 RepID=UPI001A913BF8
MLQRPRFAGKLKIDARANAVFPHADQESPCRYELKNRNFTDFSKGVTKGCGSRLSTRPTRRW